MQIGINAQTLEPNSYSGTDSNKERVYKRLHKKWEKKILGNLVKLMAKEWKVLQGVELEMITPENRQTLTYLVKNEFLTLSNAFVKDKKTSTLIPLEHLHLKVGSAEVETLLAIVKKDDFLGICKNFLISINQEFSLKQQVDFYLIGQKLNEDLTPLIRKHLKLKKAIPKVPILVKTAALPPQPLELLADGNPLFSTKKKVKDKKVLVLKILKDNKNTDAFHQYFAQFPKGVFQFEIVEDKLIYTRKYIEGVSLTDFLKKNLTEREIKDLIISILSALKERRHGQLSPSNLICTLNKRMEFINHTKNATEEKDILDFGKLLRTILSTQPQISNELYSKIIDLCGVN